MTKRKRQSAPKRYIDYDTEVNNKGILKKLQGYRHFEHHVVPTIEVQNSIARHVAKNDRSKFIEKYGIFHTSNCVKCNIDIYIYMHSNFKSTKESKLCKSCICYSTVQKKQCVIHDENRLLNSLKEKIYSVELHGYDHEKNYKKCTNAVKTKNIALITLYTLHPGTKFKCKICLEYKFINEFHTERKNTRGLQKSCNACNKLSQDCLIYKINNLITRARIKNIPVESSMSVVEMINVIKNRQNNLDYYTMIPLQHISGSPFSPSPEKIDRDGGYLIDNTALCFQILNVGGQMNWSRRLTMQIYFAADFDVRHDEANIEENSKLKDMLKNSIKNSNQRRQRRKDNSGEHSLTLHDCVELIKEQEFRCALSKLPLVFKRKHPWMASIDRINPYEGYHKWNCRIVIYRLNMGITWKKRDWDFFHQQLCENIDKVFEAEGFLDDVKLLSNGCYKLLNKEKLNEY